MTENASLPRAVSRDWRGASGATNWTGKLDIVIQETRRLENMVNMLDFSRPLVHRAKRSDAIIAESLAILEVRP
jgi:hypothetical protein